MSKTAEFRLLSEATDPITEVANIVYRDVNRFGKVSVLTTDLEFLEAISEMLWVNAKHQFVTYQFADERLDISTMVFLANEIRQIGNTPALCVINYLLDPEDIRFRHVTEIVLAGAETVDKARRQYKMYRSAGLQVSHLEC